MSRQGSQHRDGGATLQVLEEARRKMGLAEAEAEDDGPRPLSSDEGERRSLPGKIAARCWVLLLARIFEYLPLVCPRYRSDYVWES